LASGAEVAGLFSFFEDYDWQCSSVPVPKSPTAPYVIKTVKRISCPQASQCSSDMGDGMMYPGYEAKTSSVLVEETHAETAAFYLSIQRYPNHPEQSLVSLIDHQSKTARHMQIFKGAAHHCVSRNYTAAVGNATDSLSSYFAAYLGFETRPAEVFDFPWGRATIPEKKVRAFRLQPRDDVDGALPIPIDYDDDASTLLPTRIYFNGADSLNLDVKEILVESLNESAQAEALALRQSVDFSCTDSVSSVPLMKSAITEDTVDVDFYAKYYANTDDPTFVEGNGYWLKAIEEEAMSSSKVVNTSSRRLLSKRSPRRLGIALEGGFEVSMGKDASLSANIGGNCLTVAGNIDNPASPWSFSGELNMGNGCQSPSNQFSVDGRVNVAYTWGIDKSYEIKVLLFKAKIDIDCGLSIGGYIGGKVKTYTYVQSGHRRRRYPCSRRLESADLPGTESGVGPIDNLDFVENRTLEANRVDEEAEGDSSEHDDADSMSRRLDDNKGRRRRRRRRRTCDKVGFQIDAGIGVEGGCSVSRRRIGISLEGGLDLELGPWPSPLDDRAKAYISAKGCISLGPFKGCIGLPELQLFDLNI
jgi:hypothetical protein